MYHHYMVHNTQYPLTSRSLNRFSNINAFADVAYSYQISSSRHAVPTCRVCASCSCGEAIPRVSSRGGLLVAPSVRHPKGEMHSAKTFCVPQKLSSPAFSCRPAVAPFALCRERTHQGDGQPSPQEKTRMHTQNVNVRTAAPESSRKIGENPSRTRSSSLSRKNSDEEADVLEFSSLAELKKLRRSCPETMNCSYSYVLSSGVDKQFRHINVAEADHFKQFARLIARAGIDI